MFERLKNKNEIPVIEEFLNHIGKSKKLFEYIDSFLISDFKPDKAIKFDAHSRCWKMHYSVKKQYICDIIAEKDAFTVVTRLSEESIKYIYESILPYAKECIDNSPFRNRGWIEYRVLTDEHIEDIKTILRIRTSHKQKSNAQ